LLGSRMSTGKAGLGSRIAEGLTRKDACVVASCEGSAQSGGPGFNPDVPKRATVVDPFRREHQIRTRIRACSSVGTGDADFTLPPERNETFLIPA
jgi:hypothetical protein